MDFKARCLVIRHQHSIPFPSLTQRVGFVMSYSRPSSVPQARTEPTPRPCSWGPATHYAPFRAITHRGILLGCCFQPETRTRNQQQPWHGRLTLSPCRERARGEDAVQATCTTWHLSNSEQHAAACLEFADARACPCSSALCCGFVISKQCIYHKILLLWRCVFLLSKSYTVFSPSSPPSLAAKQIKRHDSKIPKACSLYHPQFSPPKHL